VVRCFPTGHALIEQPFYQTRNDCFFLVGEHMSKNRRRPTDLELLDADKLWWIPINYKELLVADDLCAISAATRGIYFDLWFRSACNQANRGFLELNDKPMTREQVIRAIRGDSPDQIMLAIAELLDVGSIVEINGTLAVPRCLEWIAQRQAAADARRQLAEMKRLRNAGRQKGGLTTQARRRAAQAALAHAAGQQDFHDAAGTSFCSASAAPAVGLEQQLNGVENQAGNHIGDSWVKRPAVMEMAGNSVATEPATKAPAAAVIQSSELEESKPSLSRTGVPVPFAISAENRAWAASKAMTVDLTTATRKFENYYTIHDELKLDQRQWDARWQNWIMKEPLFTQSHTTLTAVRRVPRPAALCERPSYHEPRVHHCDCCEGGVHEFTCGGGADLCSDDYWSVCAAARATLLRA
jgi:hypothetical protein